jgi:centrin-1
MSKKTDKQVAQKPGAAGKGKPAEKKAFNPADYERLGLPKEDIIEIKQAFDIFDSDGSGQIDPTELREAFEQLGFTGKKKFIYNILAELDEDFSGGIEFEEFLRIATAKISDKDSKKEI